jgi:glycyl-tRNA synthetase beta chain
MPQLLLELFSEEIPARMQANAARDLERMMRERLAEAGFLPEAMKSFAGPRRLSLVIEGLPAAQKDLKEEVKGPRANAPPQALEGFLRKTGLTREQLTDRDGVLFAVIERKGRPTAEVIAAIVPTIIRAFPWPKSMTWGNGTLRWVRPLHRILCVFDGEIVPFDVDGIQSGNQSEGHRFMSSERVFAVRDFDDYEAGLRSRSVILDVEERKAIILDGCKTLTFARNLEMVPDAGLLEEVAGLAEWPVPILGDMDPEFLDLPPEVIRTSMRTHQKYFAVREPGQSGLAPFFVTVANISAPDGGSTIAAGNAKVLSARLSDARFFWDEDNRDGNFEAWLKKLEGVTFHAKLGTMAQRVERIEALAREIAPMVGADPQLAAQAARLAKADLASDMVGEFPELQGVMGGYYADRIASLDPQVANAIREHYRPQGPADAVPTAPVSVAVALADKLDTLVTFFTIDEKPTGSRDPFALRRAGLGVVRILEGLAADVGLTQLLELAQRRLDSEPGLSAKGDDTRTDVFQFFVDRISVALRDKGYAPDIVATALSDFDGRVLRLYKKLDALNQGIKTESGSQLIAGFKRASNILKAEEKKGPLPMGLPTVLADSSVEEAALISALDAVEPVLQETLALEDFGSAMTALASLRAPVDAFFDAVLVNSDIPQERDNRLRLLSRVQAIMNRVADFSKITG